MAYNRMMSELDMTRAQLAVLVMILLLACDTINPVKIFLHVFPQIAPWHVATVSVLVITYIFISEMKSLLYFSVKVFFHSILSIFFREVEVIGTTNIPQYGPVIFTGNHCNQFIDGVTILSTCQHTISYLVAEKSWNRRVIGDLAWALGAVPIRRAQDSAKPGTGRVVLKDNTFGMANEVESLKTHTAHTSPQRGVEGDTKNLLVHGIDTKFSSEMNTGDKIRLSGSSIGLKILKIESDCVMAAEVESEYLVSNAPASFDVLKRIDQSQVYSAVLDKLGSGGCIGIFPEGGSHDRTDLLPLKVGVALIAYSALENSGLNIPIVPVGLNYYRGHRFRGRAIVEYGSPIYIDPKTIDSYKKGGADKRRVCNELLERIEDSMRSVIVTAPDYQTLQFIHTARRLYQRREYTASEKQDLNRRFAEGYKRLLLQTKGSPPQEWIDIQNRILAYQNELTELGIRDYQVPTLAHEKDSFDADTAMRDMRIPYRIAHLLLVIMLALVPAVLLNLPVGLIARLYSEQKRRKALAKSKVKIHGLDVMLSEKVALCIVLVPSLWFLYGLLLFLFTDLDGSAITLAVLSMPLCSYMAIMATEAGMVQVKDLRPHIKKLFPSTRRRLKALPRVRKELQEDLRTLIRNLGPILGDLYYEKQLDWKVIQANTRRSSGDLGMLAQTSPEVKKDK